MVNRKEVDATHNILQDFVERMVIADMDQDTEELGDISRELASYIVSSSHKDTIRMELLSILHGSNDPAMTLFHELVEIHL